MDGSYMVDHLLENTNYQIYGLVRGTNKVRLANIKHNLSNPRFELVGGDVSDSHSISKVIREITPNYFINFASQSSVVNSWTNPQETFEINTLGVLYALQTIYEHCPNCRFFNAGSSEEYQPQGKLNSPYGLSKFSARKIVELYRETYKLYAIQGTLHNHTSSRQVDSFVSRKITKEVSRIYKALVIGESFSPISLGNLDARRDWTHAEDIVDGVWKMLNQKNPKEYTLASGERYSVREFVEYAFSTLSMRIIDVNKDRLPLCLGATDSQINYTLGDGTPVVVVSSEFYRLNDSNASVGDWGLAYKELKWEAKIKFKDLIDKMLKNDLNLN